MKKIFFLLVLVTGMGMSPISRGNPMITYYPQVFITELLFSSPTDWQMEVEIWVPDEFLLPGVIDSIVIESNAGQGKWVTGWSVSSCLRLLITQANLAGDLNPDYYQDQITIHTYLNQNIVLEDTTTHHTLIYGYAGCEIPAIDFATQSIAAREHSDCHPVHFYKDNSPTPGLPNDLEGGIAWLHGHFYDCRDSLITGTPAGPSGPYSFCPKQTLESFNIMGYDYCYSPSCFYFDPSGNYWSEILCHQTITTYIGYIYCYPGAPGCQFYSNLPCLQFPYNPEPGDTIEQDIHLVDSSFLVSLPENPYPPQPDVSVICSPNPVETVSHVVISSEASLYGAVFTISDIRGRVLSERVLPAGSSVQFELSRHALGTAGTYIYSLVRGGITLKSGLILCR